MQAHLDLISLNNSNHSVQLQAPTSGGSSSLSSLTDAIITTPANGNLLVYNSTSSKWVNSDSIPYNLMFVYDDDSTRKMQFQLSNITSGQTRILTIPDEST